MTDEPDRDLLERFVRGDEDAFESLFRRFERDVHYWILRIVRDSNAAEDILAEAFLRAYRGRARFDCSRSFGAWMRRIATNAALDHVNRARRERAMLSPTDLPAPASAVDRDTVVRKSIREAFQRLPPKLQVVATLALIEERPHAEIADALGIPIGTVKSRLFRATRALRNHLVRLGVQL